MSWLELLYTGFYVTAKLIIGTISDIINPELAGDLLVFTVVVILLRILNDSGGRHEKK